MKRNTVKETESDLKICTLDEFQYMSLLVIPPKRIIQFLPFKDSIPKLRPGLDAVLFMRRT